MDNNDTPIASISKKGQKTSICVFDGTKYIIYYPIYDDFSNSRVFSLLGTISPSLILISKSIDSFLIKKLSNYKIRKRFLYRKAKNHNK